MLRSYTVDSVPLSSELVKMPLLELDSDDCIACSLRKLRNICTISWVFSHLPIFVLISMSLRFSGDSICADGSFNVMKLLITLICALPGVDEHSGLGIFDSPLMGLEPLHDLLNRLSAVREGGHAVAVSILPGIGSG
jgi:hypothetical protein